MPEPHPKVLRTSLIPNLGVGVGCCRWGWKEKVGGHHYPGLWVCEGLNTAHHTPARPSGSGANEQWLA